MRRTYSMPATPYQLAFQCPASDCSLCRGQRSAPRMAPGELRAHKWESSQSTAASHWVLKIWVITTRYLSRLIALRTFHWLLQGVSKELEKAQLLPLWILKGNGWQDKETIRQTYITINYTCLFFLAGIFILNREKVMWAPGSCCLPD